MAVVTEEVNTDMFFETIEGWSDVGQLSPCSDRGLRLYGYGYNAYGFDFGGLGNAGCWLRACASGIIELQSLISYPDRCGHGSVIMGRLCRLADEMGITIWLGAYPYGQLRELIPVEKLLMFYAKYGFVRMKYIREDWKSDYYKEPDQRIVNPMIRLPH